MKVLAVRTSIGENLFRKFIGLTYIQTEVITENHIGLWFLESTTLSELGKVGSASNCIRMYQFPAINALKVTVDAETLQDLCATKTLICAANALPTKLDLTIPIST
jgi:hypothetical protein